MEANANVIVDVQLRPEDVYTPFLRSRGNLARWVASVVLCLIFYDLYRDSRATILSFPDGKSILAVIAVLVLFILLALLLFPYLRMRSVFRRFPNIIKTRRYTFNPDGVLIHSEEAHVDCKWSLFRRVVETPSVFLFSYTAQGGAYVPKRCFSSKEDIVRLRKLIREKVGGKCRLRSD